MKKIRNIGLVAHIDAGKTTTTERILFYTKAIHKIGEVDNGTTTTDWYHQEKRRGISIFSTTITCFWKNHQLNFIDTPGHIDFTAEVERSLRVLDGIIVVFCGVGGVEAQSETVWRQANRYDLARLIYVNKLDREGADFYRVLEAIKLKLDADVVAVTIPIGEGNKFEGVIDLVNMQALYFDQASWGTKVIPEKIPREYLQRAQTQRESLLERVAEFSEKLLEKYLEGREIDADGIICAIRNGTIQGKLFPAFAGSSLRNIGIQPLIDGICNFLPSPLERGKIKGFVPKTGKQITKDISKTKSLLALVFKVTTDRHGELTYLRLYSGSLHRGLSVYNPRIDKSERITNIYKIQAIEKRSVGIVGTGEIVAVTGLKSAITGDTICDKSDPVLLERIRFAETVASMSIEPKTSQDRDKLIETLEKLQRNDPTFKFHIEKDTDQIIISGMGELHLDIIKTRVVDDFHVKANVGKPRISYRETISEEAEAESTATVRVGEKNYTGGVSVKVSPDTRCVQPEIEFDVPQEKLKDVERFMPAIKESLRAGLTVGNLAGYPLIYVRAVVYDVKIMQDTSEAAISMASSLALKKALSKVGGVLLEPHMRFEITTPDEYVGSIISDLNRKQAQVREVESRVGVSVLRGYVALSKMFGYADALRSMTQGHGFYLLEPYEYRPVPEDEVKRMLGEFI